MSAPSQSADQQESATQPRWLGKYEVLRHLATGGMAEIFLARTTGIQGFEKLVVVKRMLPALAAEPDCVRLFLNEARLAAQLQHANVVQVYDVGTEDGAYFIAMEFVHGVDVRALATRARQRGREIPLEVSLSIAIDVCAGLHYAHERRDATGRPLHVVHCDVSPSNVLLAWDGTAKLADFGIAKAGGRSAETRQTALRGKFGYMAPEQCLGELLDRRSDVYAVALLLAELTTGRRIFVGASDYEIMKQVVDLPPPRPGELRPGYPRSLERIVLKGMARQREERWETARDLQIALEELARARKLNVSPVRVSDFLGEIFAEEVASFGGSAEEDGVALAQLTASLRASWVDDGSVATTAEPLSPRRVERRRRRRRWRAAAVLAAAGVALGAAAIVIAGREPAGDAPSAPEVVAPAAPEAPPPRAPAEASSPPPVAPAAAPSAAAETPPEPPARSAARRPARKPARKPAAATRRRESTPGPAAPTPARAPAPWDPESAAPPP